MRSKIALSIFCVLCVATSARAQDNSTQQNPAVASPIARAVSHCVAAVHQMKSDAVSAQFFKHFDAFYNPATQHVENNAVYVGDQQPLYEFNKCMALQGFPLSYGK